MWSESRPRRPYEKKTVTKGGALIFGMGLGALLATVAIMVGLILPNLSSHLDNLSYRARTYYRKLVPHPEYLPTPAPTAAAAVVPAQDGQIEMKIPPIIQQPAAGDIIPAAINVTGDGLVLAESPEETAPLENVAPLPSSGDSVQLRGVAHQWQTWNNCGPATLTMYMSYYGRPETQAEAAPALKPNRDDKNVSAHELAAYARTTGLEAIVRQGGTLEQLKRFLSNDIPVMAETWLVHEGDGLGHYRLITGYDDATGQFNTFDSLNGPDYKVSYEQFAADWRVFNNLYIVVYAPAQADTVKSIIGADLDNTRMYERILAQAQAEVAANPNDAIAYFNQGEALTRLGRPQEAVVAFDRARQLGLHWRRLWYQFAPFEAYYAVGRYQDVLDLTAATLEGTGGLEEAYYYHGLALHATGQPGAEADFQAALEYNPLFTPAAEALNLLLTNR
ncbi:MAG: C39 family peptidase [Anaerolineae bacterium]|nr:C39 family peptidase [Anaerolineae bacterium]